jgi:N-acetylglucosamine-6-phosphate deacetylase
MSVEIIADGHHLPRELLSMIYKFKGADRIALITDSMRGAGMPEGKTVLGNRKTGIECIIEGGVAKLFDRTSFAGSVCTADRLVKTMYKTVGVPITDAIKMMCQTPARLIGLDKEIGTLDIGKRADIVIFDDDINVFKTIVGGKTVYEK